MFGFEFDSFADFMAKGGPVMWPLLLLSVGGLTLVFERCWFWVRMNNAMTLGRFRKLGELLRRGDRAAAKTLAENDPSVYGRVVALLLAGRTTEAAAAAAVEAQRPRVERFMGTLSTIITAAPMLGILGTVVGLIGSFEALGPGVNDPRAISPQIAQALITTAVGLLIAIVILFPYNAFRAQVDRTLARIETLIMAAMPEQKGSD